MLRIFYVYNFETAIQEYSGLHVWPHLCAEKKPVLSICSSLVCPIFTLESYSFQKLINLNNFNLALLDQLCKVKVSWTLVLQQGLYFSNKSSDSGTFADSLSKWADVNFLQTFQYKWYTHCMTYLHREVELSSSPAHRWVGWCQSPGKA